MTATTAVAPLRIGVIGVGRIGRMHAELIAHQVPGAALGAVYDAYEPAARGVAAAFGVPAAGERGGDLRLRSRRGGDLLELRHPRRPPDRGRGGRQGGVLREAGVARPVRARPRARRDRRRRRAVPDRLQPPVRPGARVGPGGRRVGRGGEPHLVRISSRDPEPPPLEYVKSSGGLFLDMMIHDFDMARFVTGSEVVEVFARGALRIEPSFAEAGDIDTALVTLVHEDGCLTAIDNSRRAAYGYDQRVEVFGSAGMAVSENPPAHTGSVHDRGGRAPAARIRTSSSSGTCRATCASGRRSSRPSRRAPPRRCRPSTPAPRS